MTTTTGLINNATRRANALAAGLAGELLRRQPGLSWRRGDRRQRRLHQVQRAAARAAQAPLARPAVPEQLRVREGLQFGAVLAAHDRGKSVRRPARKGGVTHAFKGNWTYELPFGQGRRFGGSAGPWLDRLIGGWSFDGIARVQSGTPARLRQRAAGRHDARMNCRSHSSCGSTMRTESSTCCRRTSSTTRPGIQRQRDVGHRLQRRGTNGPLYRTRQHGRLHRDGRRFWRLRFEQRRGNRAAAGAVRPECGQACGGQGPVELRIPCGVPQCIQPPVVHTGHGTRRRSG